MAKIPKSIKDLRFKHNTTIEAHFSEVVEQINSAVKVKN